MQHCLVEAVGMAATFVQQRSESDPNAQGWASAVYRRFPMAGIELPGRAPVAAAEVSTPELLAAAMAGRSR